LHVSRQTFPPCFPFLPSLTFISRSDHTLHLTPYTLHPTPYTLHPTPHTLHPTPYTLHPQPYTLHQSGRCASQPKRAFTLHSRLVWKYVCRTISGFFSLSLSHSLSLSYTHTHTHTHTHTLQILNHTPFAQSERCASRPNRARSAASWSSAKWCPPWRQPRGKYMVSLVNSHANTTLKG
jgi:hypothetical protein